jgi:hypothetical protein
MASYDTTAQVLSHHNSHYCSSFHLSEQILASHPMSHTAFSYCQGIRQSYSLFTCIVLSLVIIIYTCLVSDTFLHLDMRLVGTISFPFINGIVAFTAKYMHYCQPSSLNYLLYCRLVVRQRHNEFNNDHRCCASLSKLDDCSEVGL